MLRRPLVLLLLVAFLPLAALSVALGVTALQGERDKIERDALDRFTAAFMSNRVGASFMGRISGVTRFGLFIQLDETGADGLVPVSTLGDEYFVHDERTHALVGERTGSRWVLGTRVNN